MGITSISGQIRSQPLNDNFSYLNSLTRTIDNLSTVTASTTLTITAVGTILVNATSSITLTLPQPSASLTHIYNIKNISTGYGVYIQASSATVEGRGNYILTDTNEFICLASNKSNAYKAISKSRNSDFINVLDYADDFVVDGVIDATLTIQSALGALPTAGGTLYFPSTELGGTYYIASDFTFTAYTTCTLKFDDGAELSWTATLTGNKNKIDAGFHKIFSGGNFTGSWTLKEIPVEWFGAVGDGTTNDTTAFKNAITFAGVSKSTVVLADKDYLITDTLPITGDKQIKGTYRSNYTYGYANHILASRITFTPTASKTLFNVYTSGAYTYNSSIYGIYIYSNSANADIALHLNSSIYNVFKHMSIYGFTTGIKCTGTINNSIEHVYINNCTNQCVLYDGLSETTDTWNKCVFWGSPIGIQSDGVTINIRFTDCLFEQLDTYGVYTSHEDKTMSFINCYSEDVPFTTASGTAMFKIGYNGTATLTVDNAITIIGGNYSGRNAGATGKFFDCDYLTSAFLVGVNASRYSAGITTSANTKENGVYVSGFVGVTLSVLIGGTGRIQGFYPATDLADGGYKQNISVADVWSSGDVRVDQVMPNGASDLEVSPSSGGATRPVTNNSSSLGDGTKRWTEVFATNGTINTSDIRMKTDIKDIDDKVITAIKEVKMLQFRFRDKPDKIQIGMMAQDIIKAFEKQGLNALDYGVVRYDEWEENGEKKDLYSVNYDQLIMLKLLSIRG